MAGWWWPAVLAGGDAGGVGWWWLAVEGGRRLEKRGGKTVNSNYCSSGKILSHLKSGILL